MKSQKKHFSFEVINDENFCVWTKQHRSELIHRAVSTSACTNLAKLSTGMSMYFLKDLKLGPSPVMMLQIDSQCWYYTHNGNLHFHIPLFFLTYPILKKHKLPWESLWSVKHAKTIWKYLKGLNPEPWQNLRCLAEWTVSQMSSPNSCYICINQIQFSVVWKLTIIGHFGY